MIDKKVEKRKLPLEDFYRYLPYEENIKEYQNINNTNYTKEIDGESWQLLDNLF